MEARNLLRFLFLSLSVAACVLVLTFIQLSYPLPRTVELLNSATNSAWDTPHHPLDPLTIREFEKVRSILSSHELFKSSRYALHSVDLEEPEKTLVLKWKKGETLFPRKASVVARVDSKSVYVLTVDLGTGKVTVRETGEHSGYPMLTVEDVTGTTLALFASADFNRTIVQRGIDLADLACLPISTGWYGKSEENRRLIKVQFYSMDGTANFYMRPIEGLTCLLELDTKQVVEISDTGRNIPIPKAADTDYRYSVLQEDPHAMKPLNPISIEQPKGPSFTVEDKYLVKWATGNFT